MSINNMAGITRSATVDSSATNTTYRFFDSPGDTAVISPPDIGVAFGGVNSGILLPALGNHTVTYDWSYWTATIPLTTSQCIVDVTVQGKPYFKVNGDLSSTSGAPIKAFNKADPLITYLDPTLNDRTGKSGSSAQGIIVGSNVIEGVSSGAFFPLLGIKPLTFANTGATAPANTLFGGGFGVSGFSLPSVDSNAVPYNALDDLASGSFINAGDLSFGENIPAGIHITIFVTGDLTIGSDIIYNDAGGYATFGDIPHVKFVVLKNGAGTGGNVYINGSVKQIDAEIIAETSIDTCMEATWVDCNTPLVVNGALASAKIALNRLNGTLRSSTPDDGKIVAGVYTNAANIGELIQFTPELYLSTPGEPQTVPPGNHYDSITSLPPRF
jgi:hypothetical protein